MGYTLGVCRSLTDGARREGVGGGDPGLMSGLGGVVGFPEHWGLTLLQQDNDGNHGSSLRETARLWWARFTGRGDRMNQFGVVEYVPKFGSPEARLCTTLGGRFDDTRRGANGDGDIDA